MDDIENDFRGLAIAAAKLTVCVFLGWGLGFSRVLCGFFVGCFLGCFLFF